MERHILVVGAGSVGRRHLKNLSTLGCKVSAVDPKKDRHDEATNLTSIQGKYLTLDQALDSGITFDGAVIASPPVFHLEQALPFIRSEIPVLMEKPLFTDLEPALKFIERAGGLSNASRWILLGYSYRWWPALQSLRNRVQAGEIGKPLYAKFTMSAHLADWHPWERYQDFFMSSKELGGGALLDESHFIDLMLWFFGKPEKITASVDKISDLDISSDDCVDILAQYSSGLKVSIHMDLFGRPHEKSISIIGEGGSLNWTFDPNEIRFGSSAVPNWQTQIFLGERNDMFLGTAREFLNWIDEKKIGTKTCRLEDGIATLEIIEACRQSSSRGHTVQI